MDTNQLKNFISLCQTLNFSEAARRNGVSQPTMSHSISDLEKQLGAVLFLRSHRSVTITEAGMELLPRAIEMVDMAEKTAFRIRQMQNGGSGSLSIAALTTSSAALSKCLKAFSEKYPDITTDINFTSGRSQVVAMNEEKYDFHFCVREMVPAGDTFDHIISHRDQLCLALPQNHPLVGQPLDFSRLEGERFIGVSETDGPALYEEIMKLCSHRGYSPNIVCKYDRAEAVLLSVGAGMGISIIPQALSRVFYSENVAFIPIPGEDAMRTYAIAWHKNTSNPAAKLFLNVVKATFIEEDAPDA